MTQAVDLKKAKKVPTLMVIMPPNSNNYDEQLSKVYSLIQNNSLYSKEITCCYAGDPCANQDFLIESVTEFNKQIQKLIELGKELESYVKRVESHKIKNTDQINFEHNFWFFGTSRGLSRKANYLTAKEMIIQINNIVSYAKYNQTFTEIFEQVDDLRRAIVRSNIDDENYVERGINSKTLKDIVEKGLSL